MTRKQLGQWGENIALRFLRARGFVLLERNVRTPYGEIDLVTADGQELVFVEVKTRRNLRFGLPEAAVTPKKLFHLARAMTLYLETVGWRGSYRCDVVSIVVTEKTVRVVHMRNVWA